LAGWLLGRLAVWRISRKQLGFEGGKNAILQICAKKLPARLVKSSAASSQLSRFKQLP
jgi:hypothetical protein